MSFLQIRLKEIPPTQFEGKICLLKNWDLLYFKWVEKYFIHNSLEEDSVMFFNQKNYLIPVFHNASGSNGEGP